MTGTVHYAPPDADGVARITLDNPGKLNAMSVAMWRALRDAADRLPRDGARVAVVAGAGGHFASGGDIDEFPSFRFDAATLAAFHEDEVLPALAALRALDLPLLACVEGACIGGGLEIAACCDLRLAGATARFGVPIARLGFPMAPAEVELVAPVVGEALLREMLLEARVLDAAEALRRGLVARVVADARLAAEAQDTARRMAALSPQAQALNKRTLRAFAARAVPSTRAERAPCYAYAPSAEHREGLAAFLEKRPPRF